MTPVRKTPARSKKNEGAPVTLGQTYHDVITGFTGVATSRTEYMFGCVHVALEGPSKDGARGAIEVLDEQRLVEAETGRLPKLTATSGGPAPRTMPPARR